MRNTNKCVDHPPIELPKEKKALHLRVKKLSNLQALNHVFGGDRSISCSHDWHASRYAPHLGVILAWKSSKFQPIFGLEVRLSPLGGLKALPRPSPCRVIEKY